ncbi:MAG: DNA primase [Chloroflexota bacterium]
MSSVDEVKSRIDIVDLVGESVKLRRAGKNYSGLCPFHSEKTPSFIVSPDRQTWRCFGQCNEGGDVFSFVMKKEGWDFGEALRRLAERAGVELQAYSPVQQEQKEEHERLRRLLEDAVTYYRHQLVNTPAGRPAFDYLLEKRQLSEETIETFGLGYAPDGWDALIKHFSAASHPGEPGRGYSEQDLLDTGLVSQRESGGLIDRFRNRVMIPIRDERGRMAGFGARILKPDDFPKFLNSPETVLFSKSHLLYGLDRARKPIRTADQAVIVEGYLDVIALHQAGFANAVSPMGTALTEDQLRLLKRFTRKIVLALDPDAAGQKAVLRGLEAARQSFDRAEELRFDPRGLLRHEARLQADLRVASMPDDLDPDEIVLRDRDEWPRLIEAAKPVVIHVMEALSAGRDLDDAKVKADIAAQVLPLIEDLPNPVERDAYRQRLARFLRVDERALLASRASGRRERRPAGRSPGVQVTAEAPSVAPPTNMVAQPATNKKVEAHILSVLLRRPDLLNRLDRGLQEACLNRLAGEDFGYTDHQMLFAQVCRSLEQDVEDPDRYLRANLPAELAQTAEGLLEKTSRLDPADDRLLEHLFRAVVKIRRQTLSESINQLRFLQEDAQQNGDLRSGPYIETAKQLRQSLMALDKARLKIRSQR